MPECLEREFKFAVAPEKLAAALDFAPAGASGLCHLAATYFDTPAHALLDAGYVLRVRREDEQLVQAVKSIGPFGSIAARREVEVPAASHVADIELFGPAMAAELEQALNGATLQPMFDVAVERTIRLMAWSGSTFEIAFDTGSVTAGEKTAPILEVEIEQKTGAPADLHAVALRFAEATGAHMLRLTKSHRGYALLGKLPKPYDREIEPVGPGATAAEALAAVVQGCLDGFVGNWPAIQLGRDAEAVHLARVSLRRLRSVLPLCKAGVKRKRLGELAGEARRIADVLGEARNLDIVCAYLARCDGPGGERRKALERLARRAAKRREKAYGQVTDMLAALATTRFVLALQILVDDIAAVAGEGALALPAGGLADESLRRSLKRTLKSRKSPARLGRGKRHALRIALKKLRYTSDVFGGLYDGDATDDYLGQVSALQRDLGRLNDAVIIRDLLARLGYRERLPLQPGHATRRRVLLRRVSADWRRFRNSRPFWRDRPDAA